MRIKNCNTVSNLGNEFHQLVKFSNRESNSNPTSFHLIHLKLSDVYFNITIYDSLANTQSYENNPRVSIRSFLGLYTGGGVGHIYGRTYFPKQSALVIPYDRIGYKSGEGAPLIEGDGGGGPTHFRSPFNFRSFCPP